MALLYTLGEWTVKPGREAEFVAAWQELADWTVREVAGSTWGTLLRDRDVPQRFVSLGPWSDEAAIARWRQEPGFQGRVARIQQLVDGFVPHTLDLAGHAGRPAPDPARR